MSITIAKNDLITAIKQVFNSGKYATSGALKSGSISDYVYIFAPEVGEEAPIYFLNANNFTFVRAKANAHVDEPVSPCVLDINSLRKYLGRWKCESIRMAFGDSFTMWGEGSVTLPFVATHPFHAQLTRFHENTKSITWNETEVEGESFTEQTNFNPLKVTETVVFDTALQVDGDELKSCLKNCELVGTGIYMFDWDGDSNLTISSQNNTERYNTNIEAVDLFNSEEPATVQITMPMNAFINTGDICDIYIADGLPLLVVTNGEALIYRAPYRPN